MSKANDLTPDLSLHTDRSQQEINAKQISGFKPRQLEPKLKPKGLSQRGYGKKKALSEMEKFDQIHFTAVVLFLGRRTGLSKRGEFLLIETRCMVEVFIRLGVDTFAN